MAAGAQQSDRPIVPTLGPWSKVPQDLGPVVKALKPTTIRKRLADSVRLEVPGHERFDFGCWPALNHAGQGLGEPVERIDAIHFSRLQQGRHRRPGASTALAAGE